MNNTPQPGQVVSTVRDTRRVPLSELAEGDETQAKRSEGEFNSSI